MSGARIDALRASAAPVFPGVVWPRVFDANTARLALLVDALAQSEWWPADRHAANQLAGIAACARHHAAETPMFAARLAAAGLTPDDLATEAGFSALPPVGRRAMQGPADEVFAGRVPKDHAPLRTSGTSGSTGEPVTIRRSEVSRIDWNAMLVRHHMWHTPAPGLRFAALRAKLPEVSEQPDWGPPASRFFATGPILGMPNNLALEEQARLLADFRPDILLAYPSNVLGLIDLAVRGGVSFPLRQLRTIGETLHSHIREAAEAHWGAEVVDCYSSEEAGYIAIQCPDHSLYHLMAELLRVEILDDADRPVAAGQEGRVVVTDFRNFAMPLIRYAVGDRAVAGPPCPCGRGLPTLERIVGRERSLLLMPDGTRHWPLTGRSQYRNVAPVAQYQMIQTGREEIEVRLVVDRALDDGEERALRKLMIAALGHPFRLELVYFDRELPRGPTGKLEEFVCRVTA